jgi:hypothetical protein
LALALFAFGHEKFFAIRSFLDGLVSVILASILVRPLGTNGVVLGFLCGALLVPIPLDLYFFAREFDVSIREAARPYVPYLWRITAVAAAAFVILRRVQIANLLWLMVAGTLVGLLYLLVTIPHVRSTELGGYMRAAIPDFLFKKDWLFNWPKPAATSRDSHEDTLDEPEVLPILTAQITAKDAANRNNARSANEPGADQRNVS